MKKVTNYQTELPAVFPTWTAFRDWAGQQGMGDLSRITYLVPLADPTSPKGPKLLTPLYFKRDLINKKAKAESPAG